MTAPGPRVATNRIDVGVLVVAKAPVAGLAKTRLAAAVGAEAAAALAADALLDTLDAVEAVAGPADRLLSLAGDLGRAARADELRARLCSWQVCPQRGVGLAARLVAAHAEAARRWPAGRVVVQVGMDTPGLTPGDLHELAGVASARHVVGLGPAADGGWWGLSTRSAGYVGGLVDVPMSTPETCQHTRVALETAGACVAEVHTLVDVDDLDDASRVSALHPETRFARRFRALGLSRRSA